MKQPKSQTALQNYLDGLLQETKVEESSSQPRPVQLREAEILVLPTLTTPVAPTALPTPPEPVVEEKPVSERPEWSEQPFECLLFTVSGLTLAVPLQCLGSIYPLDESKVTPIFAQPEWFVGLMPTPVGNLKVLDSARWIMPERYQPDLREDFRFVISIDGHDWGMAVNEVRESVLLHPDEVKWRDQRKTRAWLAGTVIDHMCALLDVDALAQLVSTHGAPDAG